MSRISKTSDGINLNSLAQLAKTNPKYAKLFAGLAQIDNSIKDFVNDIICNIADDKVYYVQTQLMPQCYTLSLFNLDRQATVGVSWPLADFLEKSEKKKIEYDVNLKVRKMVLKFNEKDLPSGDKIIWIY